MKVINNVRLKVKKKYDGFADRDFFEIELNGAKLGRFDETNGGNIDYSAFNLLRSLLPEEDFRVPRQLEEYLLENHLEKDVEDMTTYEFGQSLLDDISELHRDGDMIKYKGNPVYNMASDEMNYEKWHGGTWCNRMDFCKFDGRDSVLSKGNRNMFTGLIDTKIDRHRNTLPCPSRLEKSSREVPDFGIRVKKDIRDGFEF